MITDSDWTKTLLAGVFVGAALTIEHLLCYDAEEHRRNPHLVLRVSNILGTMTIAAGIALVAPREETVRHITIAAVGGSCAIIVSAFRYRQEQDRALRANAHEALGASRGVRSRGWSLGDPTALFG